MTIEELLEREEGFEPCCYQDTEGYWTIGIGTLIDKRGGGISHNAAVFMMREELAGIYTKLDSSIPWWRSLNDARQVVLLSMAYQLGVSGLLKFRNTLAAVQSSDWVAAAKGMLASKWARQTPNRARRAADAMRTGEWQ